MRKVSLKFLGGAGTVTGSKYLLTVADKRLLIDCGLFQGLKELRLKNWAPFEVDPKSIHAIILTHAHIDHSGYIPKLVKDGFRGKILCTAPTLALCKILLPDTGYLQEEEAEYLNRKRATKHDPALPLFTKLDAEKSIRQFVPRNFHEEAEVAPGITVTFLYAGHILGAAMVIVRVDGLAIGFSGDVGRPNDSVFRAPERLPPLSHLVVESTYGNRRHPESNPADDLALIVNRTVERKGVVLIPAFAVGRTQTLIHFLAQLKMHGRIPDIPMFLNSPLAASATDLFYLYPALHKLSHKDCADMRDLVRVVQSVEESKALNSRRAPMIIIAASGMATGGRVLHHLKAFAPDPKNSIVLAGFQAEGTRGRSLQDKAPELKVHGEFVPVRAEVKQIENLSAHADGLEIIEWLEGSRIKPKKIFVTHGEQPASEAFARALVNKFAWSCVVPQQGANHILE